MIAPFWTDIDLRGPDGKVYLGHISRSSEDDIVSIRDVEVYDAVKSLVVTYQGDTGFLPTEVVTVTWHNVSPYPGYWNRNQVRTCAVSCESVRAELCTTDQIGQCQQSVKLASVVCSKLTGGTVVCACTANSVLINSV